MYISLFLLICAVVYIFYLRGKKKELDELQTTIALLQEQILLVDVVRKRINKLEEKGLEIRGLENEEDWDDGNSEKRIIEILLHAYHKGFYQLSNETKKEIHTTREKVEDNNFW